ncbi:MULTISPECIES: hypothetical protein [unclassified Synechocystis]|uniref:hypothetical protein n=1 Tax=unclassified Synechocystis TaxID=2640012 RepID=UPI0018721BFB|nr:MULTISPECIES: hypothetical protein [unclassified Synechocystis]MCT0253931.1 hypothetical protein [Synechocystis sp. CS-94]
MVAPPNAHSGDHQSPSAPAPESEPILCPHCRRTASNGIKCKGICVADSDY